MEEKGIEDRLVRRLEENVRRNNVDSQDERGNDRILPNKKRSKAGVCAESTII